MSYPPPVPSGARINTTPQVDLHPADHLAIHAALTDIINEMGSDPSGDSADITARFAVVCPIGVILPYAGATAPSGWGLAIGTAVSRTDYAELFAVIGTTYGVGDGSTTFNLPNTSSKFLAGKGSAGWSDALTDTGGSADSTNVTHTHTGPSHTHTGPSHTHPFSATTGTNGAHGHGWGDGTIGLFNWAGGGGNLNLNPGWAATGPWVTTGSEGGAHLHSVSGTTDAGGTAVTGASGTANTGSDGSAATNTNLPPYITVNHIIRLT